jgi:hypothetical protein
MPLEFEMPDLSALQHSPLLTLADIEAMNARCAAYLDARVAEERERAPDQYLGLPLAAHRITRTRGQSDFAAAERLLKQELQ